MTLNSRLLRCALLVAYFCVPASAVVPPEVPDVRTFQVFSPFYFQFLDNGENVLSYEGPHLLGYKSAGVIMQSVAPTGGGVPFATLPRLLQYLKTPAGILFLSTHGGKSAEVGGYIAVEAYSDSADGLNAARAARTAYLQDSTIGIQDCEIYIGTAGGYTVINVTASYFQRVIGSHAIVFVAACDSASLGSAFVSDTHKVRAFIGVVGTSYFGAFSSDGRALADIIFNSMSGVRAINSVYKNFSIDGTFFSAQNAVPPVQYNYDTLPPYAANLRLYNAPRLIEANIAQNQDGDGTYEKTLYSYINCRKHKRSYRRFPPPFSSSAGTFS